MLFFALLAITALGLRSLARIGRLSTMMGWPRCIRGGLMISLLVIGTDHLLNPDRYIPMISGFMPYPKEITYFTGFCEILGAIGLAHPRTRRAAGYMLALYFICVFPANISNAAYGIHAQGLPEARWYYLLRLPMQPLAIIAALIAGNIASLRGTVRGIIQVVRITLLPERPY